MTTEELQQLGFAHKLFLIENDQFTASTLGLGEFSVIGGGGIMVGTMIPTGDGRWLAIPGTFPFRVGDTTDVFEFLSSFGAVQTFPVCVVFDGGQLASLERNEDVVLNALKKNVRKFIGGKVEGIQVGTASWDA